MNKEIKEALQPIEDKFNDVPGNMPIVATGTPMVEVYRIVSDLLKKRDEELLDSLPENILAEEVLYISPERNVLTKEEYDNFMEHYSAVKGYETSVQVYWEYKRN